VRGAGGRNMDNRSIIKSLASRGPIILDRDERRLWIMPYYTHSRASNENAKATKSDNEGIIMGYEHKHNHNKYKEYLGALVSIGMGENKSPSTIAQDNKIDSRVIGIGGYYKRETEKIELDAVINGTINHHKSKRYGSHLPNEGYTAISKYYSRSLSADLVGLWKYPVNGALSIRPDIGLSMDHRVRDKHSESGAGIYNHTYLKKTTNSFEPYAGVGMRKEWYMDKNRYRLTAIYEHGYECADNDTTTKITTLFGPTDGYSIRTRGAGRNADYLTVHASALNYEANIKVMAGYIGVSKKHLKSHTFVLKAEKRF
jgi:hypothetical protein